MIQKPQPFSPMEFLQARLRLVRAMSRVANTPAANSPALEDMQRLVATVDALDERLKAAEQERDGLAVKLRDRELMDAPGAEA